MARRTNTTKTKDKDETHPLQGDDAPVTSPDVEWIDARQGLRPQPHERVFFASVDGDVYFGYWDGEIWNTDPAAYVGLDGHIVAFIPLLDAIPTHPGWKFTE